MKWKRIPKENALQPTRGTYSDWKEQIAKEAEYRCVYCGIFHSSFGGLRCFHVEHFKPKSKYDYLENTFSNLFYACPVCNTFKNNDWPDEPNDDHSIISYPNPCLVDYTELFHIDDVGLISGQYVASRYIVQKLHMNRNQLIMERKLKLLKTLLNSTRIEIERLYQQIQNYMDDKESLTIISNYIFLLNKAIIFFTQDEIDLYSNEDLR